MAWASVSFSRFCPGAVMIPGRASCLIISLGGLPISTSSPHPSPYRKENPASKQAVGRIASAIASRLANGGQASKTRTTDGLAPIPIITRSHGLPIPCHIASIAPPPRQEHNETHDETTTDAERRDNGTTIRRDSKTTERQARTRRQTRRRTRRTRTTTRAKASNRGTVI